MLLVPLGGDQAWGLGAVEGAGQGHGALRLLEEREPSWHHCKLAWDVVFISGTVCWESELGAHLTSSVVVGQLVSP